jgi:hypothetical protein
MMKEEETCEWKTLIKQDRSFGRWELEDQFAVATGDGKPKKG